MKITMVHNPEIGKGSGERTFHDEGDDGEGAVGNGQVAAFTLTDKAWRDLGKPDRLTITVKVE